MGVGCAPAIVAEIHRNHGAAARCRMGGEMGAAVRSPVGGEMGAAEGERSGGNSAIRR